MGGAGFISGLARSRLLGEIVNEKENYVAVLECIIDGKPSTGGYLHLREVVPDEMIKYAQREMERTGIPVTGVRVYSLETKLLQEIKLPKEIKP